MVWLCEVLMHKFQSANRLLVLPDQNLFSELGWALGARGEFGRR